LLSIDTDPRSGGHDTLSLPLPDGEAMRADYTALVQRARAAFQARDAVAIAAVATRSAELNQRTLSMRGFQALRMLGVTGGALGLQISHSGTVAGLLFHPQDRPAHARAAADSAARARDGAARDFSHRSRQLPRRRVTACGRTYARARPAYRHFNAELEHADRIFRVRVQASPV
jgi:hypothetical protein